MRWHLVLLVAAGGLGIAATKDSCLECHTAIDSGPTSPASLIKTDIHTARGFNCASCHGGDSSNDDMELSMSAAKGFKGKIARKDIPRLCAGCHSRPDIMRKFAPQQRVDQFELYQTSVHGKRLAAGDPNVATCIDCHSVHNIRSVKDAQSPVYPPRLPETCSRCHADQAKMAKYSIPATQFRDYQSSVHWEALAKRGDLSAPNCASCHGNHGAKPPQVESVAAVCGLCHVTYDQRYEKSVHKAIFSAAAGGGGCVVCHSNHAIHKPSPAMLAGKASVCAQCHEDGSTEAKTGAQMAEWLNGLEADLKRSEAVLARAEQYGMEVSEAQVHLHDGWESLVKSRLELHTFRLADMSEPVKAGFAVAKETRESGEAALREKDFRRRGLAASVVFIIITILAIRLLIRRIEANGGARQADLG
jgi:predicted CXXCH cytochrome family protein